MKTLLKFICVLAYFLCLSAQAADTRQELENITGLQTRLEQKGINKLIEDVQKNGWAMPYIPSQWHVEHVSKSEQKSVDIAAREFGQTLAKKLVEMAEVVQKLPAGEELDQQTVLLCNLSDWCASVEGYGNVFLAQRALDLAAVGVARLAVNLDFPVEKSKGLTGRMSPAWMSADTALSILNKDAGAPIFSTSDRDEMERTYGSGKRLLAEQRNPLLLVERQKNPAQWRLVETPEVKANLTFFDGVESGQVNPFTLVNLWDRNWHLRIITGLELQSINKARALGEFRQAIGKFPEKPVFTAEELREREQGNAEAKKRGLKVTNMEDTYSSPMAAAFAQAWKNYLEKNGENLGKIPSSRSNLDVSAFQAYDEVKRGAFLDQDCQQIKLVEPKRASNP